MNHIMNRCNAVGRENVMFLDDNTRPHFLNVLRKEEINHLPASTTSNVVSGLKLHQACMGSPAMAARSACSTAY